MLDMDPVKRYLNVDYVKLVSSMNMIRMGTAVYTLGKKNYCDVMFIKRRSNQKGFKFKD